MTIDWEKPIYAYRPGSEFTYPARLLTGDLLTQIKVREALQKAGVE